MRHFSGAAHLETRRHDDLHGYAFASHPQVGARIYEVTKKETSIWSLPIDSTR